MQKKKTKNKWWRNNHKQSAPLSLKSLKKALKILSQEKPVLDAGGIYYEKSNKRNNGQSNK